MNGVRLNLVLNEETSKALSFLVEEFNMSKTQVIANALLQMQEKAHKQKRKALWLKGLEAATLDKHYKKEQELLAEAGVDDGID